jgi:hypothetical protein
MNTSPTGVDPAAIFDMVTKLGFPMLFVIGQMREWWYVKPHVELLTARLKELAAQLEHSEQDAARATGVAEEAHEIARQALELSRSIEAGMGRLEQVMLNVSAQLDELAKGERK